jgi:hypothetical protein
VRGCYLPSFVSVQYVFVSAMLGLDALGLRGGCYVVLGWMDSTYIVRTYGAGKTVGFEMA